MLADMAHANPMNLFYYKTFMVSSAIVFLYANRDKRIARYATLGMLAVYVGIAIMHINYLGIV
jgi:hypothetical protein